LNAAFFYLDMRKMAFLDKAEKTFLDILSCVRDSLAREFTAVEEFINFERKFREAMYRMLVKSGRTQRR
jgi:hypothetical protein